MQHGSDGRDSEVLYKIPVTTHRLTFLSHLPVLVLATCVMPLAWHGEVA